MKIRMPWYLAVLLLVGVITLVGLLLRAPRLIYTYQARQAYEAARLRWESEGSDSYTMVVFSNAYTQPTEGRNELRVEAGVPVKAENPNCQNCPPAQFAAFTIENLFQRIAAECFSGFPRRFCQVAYDETLGYPRRIDFYPYNLDGVERPSITVMEVHIFGLGE